MTAQIVLMFKLLVLNNDLESLHDLINNFWII